MPALTTAPRVLIVDDEPSVRMVARLMLERTGHAVEEAGDAAGAVSRIESGPLPAVVLLDVTLPDRPGTDLVSELRRLAPDVRIVLTSGLPEDAVPNHGADSYLHKPFTKEQLVTAVRGLL